MFVFYLLHDAFFFLADATYSPGKYDLRIPLTPTYDPVQTLQFHYMTDRVAARSSKNPVVIGTTGAVHPLWQRKCISTEQ